MIIIFSERRYKKSKNIQNNFIDGYSVFQKVVQKEAEMYESRRRVDNPEVRPKSSLLDIADIAGSEKFTSMSEIASCSYEARKAGNLPALHTIRLIRSNVVSLK